MDLGVLNRLPGTMWDGLDFDQAPEQGVSPLPYLSLTDLLASSAKAWAKLHASKPVAASRTARSDEGASTERLPATVAPQQTAKKSTGFDFAFSDLRRCSTADQSRLRDFEDFSDGD